MRGGKGEEGEGHAMREYSSVVARGRKSELYMRLYQLYIILVVDIWEKFNMKSDTHTHTAAEATATAAICI